MVNLLANPRFEGSGSYQDGIPEIYAPDNWRIWWHPDTKRPEAKVIKRVEPFLDPPRIYDGNQAVQLFTFSSRQHAGLYQVVTGLEMGASYRFGACAHAWSAHKDIGPTPHDAHCSAGVGCGPKYIPEGDIPALNGNPENDAIGNFTFCVGVSFGEPDPTGAVVWGRGAHIYNAYFGVLPVQFKAPSDGKVVVYLRATSLWGFENSDAYWDKAELVRIDDIPPDPDPQPSQRGQPREQYDRVYLLFPQGYGLDWLLAAFEAELETGTRHTFGFSADDAGIGDLDKRRVIAVNPDEIGTGLTEDWYKEHYPGVEYTPLIAHSPEALKFLLIGLDGPPPSPDPEPPPDPPPDPPPTGKMLVGIHDVEAADWALANGVPLLLAHYSIDEEPQILDFNALATAGVRVFVRLHWGYAGRGTIPPPDKVGRWILEVAQTIQLSRGVWGWQICNEINNPTEWPGGYPSPTTVVTPGYYVETYREIHRLVRESGSGARLATSPLDPYNVVAQEFGQPGDPAEWARIIYERCEADFISFHAKEQYPGSPSDATFTDRPLIGRYQNMRSIEDQIFWTLLKDALLPVYVTEANQQRNAWGALGWADRESARRFVHDTCSYLRGWDIAGVVFYRWHADDWALQNRPAILAAIQEEAAR